MSFGKSLSEALYDMQERIPSDTINNVILSLTQSNLYGNSIIDNLYFTVDATNTTFKDLTFTNNTGHSALVINHSIFLVNN